MNPLSGDQIFFVSWSRQDEENPSRITLRNTIDSWLKDFFAMATVMVPLLVLISQKDTERHRERQRIHRKTQRETEIRRSQGETLG